MRDVVYQHHGAGTCDGDDQMAVTLDTADSSLEAFVKSVDDTNPMALAEVDRLAVNMLVVLTGCYETSEVVQLFVVDGSRFPPVSYMAMI
mgnify:CR=1 FL=1